MANSFDLSVTYTAACIECSSRRAVSYRSARLRPFDAADYLRSIGWMYAAGGWTCDRCVSANPKRAAARLRGLQTRRKHAVENLADVRERQSRGYSPGSREIEHYENLISTLDAAIARFGGNGGGK